MFGIKFEIIPEINEKEADFYRPPYFKVDSPFFLVKDGIFTSSRYGIQFSKTSNNGHEINFTKLEQFWFGKVEQQVCYNIDELVII